jgi:hypothetical protein
MFKLSTIKKPAILGRLGDGRIDMIRKEILSLIAVSGLKDLRLMAVPHCYSM